MIVHDGYGHYLCEIDKLNGTVIMKSRNVLTKVPLAVGDVYTIVKNEIATKIIRNTQTEYEIRTLMKSDLNEKRSKPH